MAQNTLEALRSRIQDLEAEITYLRTEVLVRREVDRMESGDLEPSCESVLQVLIDNTSVPMTALQVAERTGLGLAAAQFQIEVLVKRKLAHGHPHLLAGWKYSATPKVESASRSANTRRSD